MGRIISLSPKRRSQAKTKIRIWESKRLLESNLSLPEEERFRISSFRRWAENKLQRGIPSPILHARKIKTLQKGNITTSFVQFDVFVV